jgi:hypothetical protein
MIEHLVPPRECLSLPSPAPLTSLDRAPELGLSPYRGMLASMVALELGETAECLVVAARYYASVLVLTSFAVAEDLADRDVTKSSGRSGRSGRRRIVLV